MRVDQSSAAQSATGLSFLNSSGTSLSNAAVDSEFAALLKGDDDPRQVMQDITKNGLSGMWKWQVKELEKKIAQDVLGEMHITSADLNSMQADQRAKVEKQVMKEVERRVKQLIGDSAAKQEAGATDPAQQAANAAAGNNAGAQTQGDGKKLTQWDVLSSAQELSPL